jgi:type III pantothenate kinase
MLLAVDIGNTHTVLGVFDDARLLADWRVATRRGATADEWAVLFHSLFQARRLDPASVGAMIVSSVVPNLDAIAREIGSRVFGTDPLFVAPGIKTGLPILYDNPHEVGADRIVNAVAALQKYGAPVIVVDFGTATTFDVVGAEGAYLGGVIVPGLGISAEALFQRAARLARVEIRAPERVIGKTTEESIQSGLFHGYLGLVEGLARRLRAEIGADAPLVATGGLAQVFEGHLPWCRAVDPGLTLDGLRILWERNRR